MNKVYIDFHNLSMLFFIILNLSLYIGLNCSMNRKFSEKLKK